jgi:hypothetical protein
VLTSNTTAACTWVFVLPLSSSESACCNEMHERLAVLFTTVSVSGLRSVVGVCVCVCVDMERWWKAAGRGRHKPIVRNGTNRKGWCSSNVLDLILAAAAFDFKPGHWLT